MLASREQMQPRCSRDAAEMQPRCSRGAAEMQPRCSRDSAEVRPRCGRGAAAARLKAGRMQRRHAAKKVVTREGVLLPAAGCGEVDGRVPRGWRGVPAEQALRRQQVDVVQDDRTELACRKGRRRFWRAPPHVWRPERAEPAARARGRLTVPRIQELPAVELAAVRGLLGHNHDESNAFAFAAAPTATAKERAHVLEKGGQLRRTVLLLLLPERHHNCNGRQRRRLRRAAPAPRAEAVG